MVSGGGGAGNMGQASLWDEEEGAENNQLESSFHYEETEALKSLGDSLRVAQLASGSLKT